MAIKKEKQNEKLEFEVSVKKLPITPRKLRLVADMARGKEVSEALNKLQFLNKKGAKFVFKAIKSGIANAKNQTGLEEEDLKVEYISVDEASNKYAKRYKFVSRGRIARIVKRKSHLNLILTKK